MFVQNVSHRFARSSLVAGALLAALSGTAGASPASVSATLPPAGSAQMDFAAAAQEVKRIGYQKNVYDDCPDNFQVCDVLVENLRKNRRLDVNNISCLAQSDGLPLFFFLYVGEFGEDFFAPQVSTGGFATFNAMTRFSTKPGGALHLQYVATDVVHSVNCTVSGDLVFLE
jgi:hypothetical protein